MKQFVKSTVGMTIKGSCSAGTGAMDGVDRWVASTDVTPRNNGAAGSQAWVVWTDGNGADICLSYNSGADEIFRFAFSPGGLYVVAGTANQQPTATDECSIWFTTSQSQINSTASADRVWHMWGSSDKKVFRCVLHRTGTIACHWGVEQLTSSVLSPATFSPAMWGFAWPAAIRFSSGNGGIMSGPNGSPSNGGGIARITNSVPTTKNITVGGGGEQFGNIGGSSGNVYGTERPALQGTMGHLIVPITCVSATTAAEGELGARIDWWAALTNSLNTPLDGEMYGGGALVALGATLHPWDSKTALAIA